MTSILEAISDWMTGNDKEQADLKAAVDALSARVSALEAAPAGASPLAMLSVVQTGPDLPTRPAGQAVMWQTWDDPTAAMSEHDLWVKMPAPVVAEPAPEPANIVFADDFARPDEYLSASGKWSDVLTGNDPEGLSVIGGQAGTREVTDFQVVRLAQEVPQDVAIQCRVLATAKTMTDNRGVTLCVRMQGAAADGYLPDCYYMTITAGAWVFKKRVGSQSETMAENSLPITFPTVVRLEARGDTFEGFINGQRMFTLSDEALTGGSVAFGLKAASAEGAASVRVDDLQVEEL